MDNLELKQKQYNFAMELYENKKIYQKFGKLISITNVFIQFILLYLILPMELSILWNIFAFVIAYILADFINGLVHMYMDNNENYTSIAGPFVASFHLHHRTPLYKKNKILIVYFNESGSKIWLAIFEILTLIIILKFNIGAITAHILIYFFILSCIAELSHYLCHVSNSKFVEFLRKIRLLLGKKHHGRHHLQDNVNYAFLNGMTDPIINLIAKKFYSGYKNGTDKHYKYYQGNDTKNR